ncbi:MAG: restriction endonuclease [Hyphomicrobiales bacterium]|nr:restriction endonuclease [Hyphomicrobiales bacterium]
MLENVRGVLTNWIVGLFVRTIKSIPRPEARIETLNWLSSSREIVASSRSARDKFLELYRSLNARRGVAVAFESVASAVKAYAKSDLPLAAKLALPATVLALPFAGGQAAGIAAFGSAIGVPVLLLIFIGAAGITAIIEACATNETARAYTMSLLDRVAQDERFRAFRAAMRTGSQGEPRAPNRATSPIDADREEWLRSMDPLEFQDHVMSFFPADRFSNIFSSRRGSDRGVDGYATHQNGLVVIQCKRYGAGNKVGGPAIREFRGAMHENSAMWGVFVTTSSFTAEAELSASKSLNLSLVDMRQLLQWHENPPDFGFMDTVLS